MSIKYKLLIFAGCILVIVYSPYAQSSNKTLSQLLDGVVDEENISISYDAALLSEVIARKDWMTLSWDQLRTIISDELPLEIIDLEENRFVIRSRISTFKLILSEDKNELVDSTAFVLTFVNGESLPSTFDGRSLTFEYLPKLEDTVQIQVLGYALAEVPAKQLLNALQHDLMLRPIEVRLAGLTVVDFITTGININPSDQQISIVTSQLPLLPGETDGDIFSSLSAIPGISTPDNRPGNIYIRGSSTDQTLITYEDIPIYHRGHYFGTISPYNPQVIEEVNVSRSGFDPSMGGRVGGKIEINAAVPNSDDSRIGLASNSLFGSGFVKIPFEKIGVSFGARRSYPVTFRSPKLSALSRVIFDASAIDYDSINLDDFNVLFEDYQFGIHSKGKLHQVDVSGLHSSSRISYPVNVNDEEENLTRNSGFNFKWKQRFNNKLSNRFSLTISDYYFGFNNRQNPVQLSPNPPDSMRGPAPGMGPLRPPPRNRNVPIRYAFSVNQIFDLKWADQLSIKSSSGDEWQFGLDLQYQSVRINYQDQPNRSPDSTQSSSPPVRINEKTTAWTHAGYFNYKLNRFQRFYTQTGARLEYFSPTDELRISPRLFASFDASHALTLKTSLGRYFQYLSQVQVLQFTSGGFSNQLWQLADGDELSVLQGDLWMMGALFHKRKWVLDFETYLKRIQNVNYFSSLRLVARGNRDVDNFFYQVDQTFIGFDISLKRSLGDHFSLWSGYSYLQASLDIINGDFGNIPLNSLMPKYSQPHVIYIGQSFEKDNFKVSSGWRYASGLTTQSPEYRLSAGIDPENLLMLPDRFSAVHWLDISASYLLPKTEERKLQMIFGLSLVNVYNQSNVTDQVQRVDEQTANLLPEDRIRILVERNAITFAPNLNVSIEW